MTVSTETERAEFDAWWQEWGLGGYDVQFEAWRAARRAPAVPVPQIAEVQDSLVAISAAIADQDDSAAQSMLRDLLSMLAAAPQPPEAGTESIEHCARMDMNYALGMREGWNRCVLGDEAGYAKRREQLISEARKVLKDAPEATVKQSFTVQLDDTNVADIAQAVDLIDAAPVQLPEPVAVMYHNSVQYSAPAWHGEVPDGTKLYTEQQVLQLLAAKQFTLDELAMLTRKLVQSLRKAAPGNESAEKALDYLKRKGLGGNPLRSTQESNHGQQT